MKITKNTLFSLFALALLLINTYKACGSSSAPHFNFHAYRTWRQEAAHYFTEKKFDNAAKNKSLLETLDSKLRNSKATAQDKLLALHCYNYLRELNKLPIASSIAAFDMRWLAWLRETIWIKHWQENKASISERQRFLLAQILNKSHTPAYKLCAYTILCKLLKRPTVHSPKLINNTWLKNLDYDLWKREKTNTDDWRKASILNKLYSVANAVKSSGEELPQDREYYTRQLLYSYNYLRELLKLPRVAYAGHINKIWLSNTFKHIRKEFLKNVLQLEEATQAERKLLEAALATLKLKKDITPLLNPETYNAHTTGDAISFCRCPDLDTNIGTLYHELGHIVKGVDFPKDQAELIKRLNHPGMKHDIARMNTYLQKGLSVVTTESQTGQLIYAALEKQPLKWEPQEDQELFYKRLYRVNNERRADLFMLDELYKQNKITPLLTLINIFAQRGTTTVSADATHPAHIERALCMIGFLADKNIAVNDELKKWEEEGICIPKDSITPKKPHSIQVSPAAQAVEKVLAPMRAQQEKERYAHFKKSVPQNARTSTILLRATKAYLENYRASPSLLYEKSALYCYNYARELLKQPLISTINQIDQGWIDKQ